VCENLIDITKLSYRYPTRDAPSVVEVDLSVRAGELVLLSGPTGCGKSTLLHTMNGIIPHDAGGELSGSVTVLGRETRDADLVWLSSRVGLVFQSPEDQLFNSRLEDEVAFGLENLRLERDLIVERVRWALAEVGLSDRVDTPVGQLSGGQKQRLAVASVMAMQPKVLLLDEPLSQLDSSGAEQVLEVIGRLRSDLDIAIVLVEHRMHTVAHLADRIVLMDAGRIVLDVPREDAFDDTTPYETLGLRLPEPVELMRKLGRPERPLTADDAVKALRDTPLTILSPEPAASAAGDRGEAMIDLRRLRVRYGRRGDDVLRDVDLEVFPGDVVAVLGANGSGKSTLLYTLLGSLRPASGAGTVLGEDVASRRRLSASAGMLFQNPELMLLADSVSEEVAAGPMNQGLDEDEALARAAEVMSALGVAELADEPPLALSRGQRLRVALASVLSMKPRLLLLDEPTTGQDRDQIESMMAHLVDTLAARALVFCTHDVTTVARYATAVIVLAEGRVLASGTPAEVFADAEALHAAGLRPPVATDIARGLGLPPVASVDALARCLAREERS